jgi:hypothetical protein
MSLLNYEINTTCHQLFSEQTFVTGDSGSNCKIFPFVLKWLYWSKFKFRTSHRPNLIFLASQISLAARIQVSRPRTYVKGTFRCVAHYHFLLNELNPQKCQSLGFHSEHRAAKLLTTWQLMDVLPRPKLLNVLTTLTFLPFLLVRSFTAKEIYLKEARSGPFQDLSLQDRNTLFPLGERLANLRNKFIISILPESLFLWVSQRNSITWNGGWDGLLSVLMGWVILG